MWYQHQSIGLPYVRICVFRLQLSDNKKTKCLLVLSEPIPNFDGPYLMLNVVRGYCLSCFVVLSTMNRQWHHQSFSSFTTTKHRLTTAPWGNVPRPGNLRGHLAIRRLPNDAAAHRQAVGGAMKGPMQSWCCRRGWRSQEKWLAKSWLMNENEYVSLMVNVC